MQVWAPDVGFGPALPKFNRCASGAPGYIACLDSSTANRGFPMKAIFSLVVLAAMAVALVFPITGDIVLAQAPTGPQPAAQPQQNPPPAKTPDTSQKPQEGGVAIA